MGIMTDIEWCDSTVNPTTGCDGCELWKLLSRKESPPIWGGPCYAGNYHEKRMAKALPRLYAQRFTEVRLAPGRMAQAAAWSDLRGTRRPGKPWLDGMPRMIFIGDMGDIFSRDVPFEYLRDEVIQTAHSRKGARHIWMLLTKQPGRMVLFSNWLDRQRIHWPENVWAGTSVTSEKTIGRAHLLGNVPAPVRYLSAEPLRSAIHPERLANGDDETYDALRAEVTTEHGHRFRTSDTHPINWVIVGGESAQAGHAATPFDVQWALSLIRSCRGASVPCFVKQLGSMAYDSKLRISIDGPDSHAVQVRLDDHHGGDWDEWPSDLRVREMPAISAAFAAPVLSI